MSGRAKSRAKISLGDFNNIVFFSGAGLSAESGIPTYRGRGGVWEQYNWEEYACQRAFEADPEKVWDFHDKRRAAVAACEPNAGHHVIAAVERAKPNTTAITQNIDGLHQRVGSRNIIELHGSLWRVRCEREGKVTEDFDIPINPRQCSCGAYWRPDIVWFGDLLNRDTLNTAAETLSRCDLLVSVGTSGVVYPAAELPRIAMDQGATTIEINLEETPVSHLYQHILRGKASKVLAALWE